MICLSPTHHVIIKMEGYIIIHKTKHSKKQYELCKIIRNHIPYIIEFYFLLTLCYNLRALSLIA